MDNSDIQKVLRRCSLIVYMSQLSGQYKHFAAFSNGVVNEIVCQNHFGADLSCYSLRLLFFFFLIDKFVPSVHSLKK